MPLNTLTVSLAVTPTVVQTYLQHYLNRKDQRQKPTAHISYHEGLVLIRRFLDYASQHTVEELQRFTAQWVPTPRWVRVEEVLFPSKPIAEAAEALQHQLGPHGIDRVGGKKWWQWRRQDLKAEWIEMRSDYDERKKYGRPLKRVMLYVHGGAYYFGSVDEHRYQIQRHARKLKARVLARLLVILRDQGIPLPAGAILISPWVDLTHSFPSVATDTDYDYIPPQGFRHRPSAAWPPPTGEDMVEMIRGAVDITARSGTRNLNGAIDRSLSRDQGVLSEGHGGATADSNQNGAKPQNPVPGPGHPLSIVLDGKTVQIDQQIQMYATNQLLSHPLVSPILQPSLGGLPPLLILTGGGEMLRDEQIYLAHKAARPAKYPPGDAVMALEPHAKDSLRKWKGTDVQLQVWEDCCHVTPTLSFTRPAKFMYRSIAQFGAWALARAQETEIEIMDDDDVSVISSNTDRESSDESTATGQKNENKTRQFSSPAVGRAGDPLPPFKAHMIRQAVDRHGNVHELQPAQSLPALQMAPGDIGVIKPGPVRKWLVAKNEWDSKFAREKKRQLKRRAQEMARGYEDFSDDDVPPPSALAGRRDRKMHKERKNKRSWGMSLWSLWGSSHDEKTIEREEKADKEAETTTATPADGANAQSPSAKLKDASRSRSRRRTVSDSGQTRHQLDEQDDGQNHGTSDSTFLTPTMTPSPPAIKARPGNGQPMSGPHSNRPTEGGIAYPFKLAAPAVRSGNASTMTLTSELGVLPDPVEVTTPRGVSAEAEVVRESEKAELRRERGLESPVDTPA